MKILLVEDDYKIAQAIKRGLKQQSYQTDLAHDGDTGLHMAQAGNYDIIILDIMLPGNYSGLDIVKTLREEKSTAPILMLTAKDSIIDKAHGLNIGADDYLVKPFAFVELIARIRALLRRHQSAGKHQFTAGKLSLDYDNRSATFDSHHIPLSRREFALLEYFMARPNKIITKTELIEHVWDSDDDILENTVEVYVGALRKKIETPHDAHFIHTKRGFGYIFKETL